MQRGIKKKLAFTHKSATWEKHRLHSLVSTRHPRLYVLWDTALFGRLSVSLPVFHLAGFGMGKTRGTNSGYHNGEKWGEAKWEPSVSLMHFDCRCGNTSCWPGEEFGKDCLDVSWQVARGFTTQNHSPPRLRHIVFQSFVSSFVQWRDLCLYHINCVKFPEN